MMHFAYGAQKSWIVAEGLLTLGVMAAFEIVVKSSEISEFRRFEIRRFGLFEIR